ncbi:MAG: glycosyltransferase [Chlamydiales bacterium]
MSVAVVHDWLTVYGGAERALEQILTLFPHADLFSLIDFFPQNLRHHLLDKKADTTFIQKLPFAKKGYRNYLPLMPFAVEQLDMREYDLVISSSHAVAKGVLTAPDQLHLCYCYSPLRYAWDRYHDYLQPMKGPKRWIASWVLHKMRLWDVRSSHGVDAFAAISRFVAKRIKKIYNRPARVIYPPVCFDSFPLKEKKEDFYVTASRLVPYKRIDLIIEAFRKLPSKRLYVIGEGPEKKKLSGKAPSNVTLLGHQSSDALSEYLSNAKAFIFAAIEDFGIAPLEAQACGTPVIAYEGGAVCETLEGFQSNYPTGCFFNKQTPEALREAIEIFEQHKERISAQRCRQNAERFSISRFQNDFLSFVEGSKSNLAM